MIFHQALPNIIADSLLTHICKNLIYAYLNLYRKLHWTFLSNFIRPGTISKNSKNGNLCIKLRIQWLWRVLVASSWPKYGSQIYNLKPNTHSIVIWLYVISHNATRQGIMNITQLWTQRATVMEKQTRYGHWCKSGVKTVAVPTNFWLDLRPAPKRRLVSVIVTGTMSLCVCIYIHTETLNQSICKNKRQWSGQH